MKFRDKDGNVYEDIFSAWSAWTCPNTMCWKRSDNGECEFWDTACILDWCEAHPAEAARLMGYEIVEDVAPESLPQGCHPDPPGMKGPPCRCPVCGGLDCIEWDSETDVSRCKHCGWSNGAFTSKIKEASMDKLLKDWTLGEVKEYCQNCDGECNDCVFENQEPGRTLLCRFKGNTPDKWDLTDPPRFTEDEVADARAIMRLCPDATHIVTSDFNKETKALIFARGITVLCTINAQLFPSIRPGRAVKLSDIVGRQPGWCPTETDFCSYGRRREDTE